MKTPFLVAASVALLRTSAHAAPADPVPPEPPSLARAYVTIPYSEVRALWEAAQTQKSGSQYPSPAPIPSIVKSAQCELRLGEAASMLSAQFEVDSLTPEWQTVLLLDGPDVHLETSDAGQRSIIFHEGYRLLTNQPGKINVTLQLRMAGMKGASTSDSLNLEFGRATTKRLRITGIPAGLEARVNGKPSTDIN